MIKGKLRIFILVLGLLGVVGLPLQAGAVTHNLAAEWSNDFNPHGLWSYNDGSTPIPTNEYWGELGGLAWDSPGKPSTIPIAFKVTVDNPSGFDLKSGDTGMHSGDNGANCTWTSDMAGIATVSGNAWLIRDIGRAIDWKLYVDDTLKTSGSLYSGDPYSRDNPFEFADGSGGVDALTFAISVGTKIILEFVPPPTYWNDYVGTNFTIDVNPVPAPPGVWLMGSGLLGLLAFRRRRG